MAKISVRSPRRHGKSYIVRLERQLHTALAIAKTTHALKISALDAAEKLTKRITELTEADLKGSLTVQNMYARLAASNRSEQQLRTALQGAVEFLDGIKTASPLYDTFKQGLVHVLEMPETNATEENWKVQQKSNEFVDEYYKRHGLSTPNGAAMYNATHRESEEACKTPPEKT